MAWNEITGAFEEFSDQVDVIMENETTITNIDGDIPITVELETEGRIILNDSGNFNQFFADFSAKFLPEIFLKQLH